VLVGGLFFQPAVERGDKRFAVGKLAACAGAAALVLRFRGHERNVDAYLSQKAKKGYAPVPSFTTTAHRAAPSASKRSPPGIRFWATNTASLSPGTTPIACAAYTARRRLARWGGLCFHAAAVSATMSVSLFHCT